MMASRPKVVLASVLLPAMVVSLLLALAPASSSAPSDRHWGCRASIPFVIHGGVTDAELASTRTALRSITRITGYRFNRVDSLRPVGGSGVRFRFNAPGLRKHNYLGVTYPYVASNSVIIRVDIDIAPGYARRPVLEHELGHAMGVFQHSSRREDLLYFRPYANQFTEHDKARIRVHHRPTSARCGTLRQPTDSVRSTIY